MESDDKSAVEWFALIMGKVLFTTLLISLFLLAASFLSGCGGEISTPCEPTPPQFTPDQCHCVPASKHAAAVYDAGVPEWVPILVCDATPRPVACPCLWVGQQWDVDGKPYTCAVSSAPTVCRILPLAEQ